MREKGEEGGRLTERLTTLARILKAAVRRRE